MKPESISFFCKSELTSETRISNLSNNDKKQYTCDSILAGYTQKTSMSNKCKKCGTIVSDTAKFCTECGTMIDDVNNYNPIEITDKETINEVVDKECIDSHTTYINEILPFSKVEDKTPDGEVSETKFEVLYTLQNDSNTTAKILKEVENYNKKAKKRNSPLFEFNQTKMELKGIYCPCKQITSGMNVFKVMHYRALNASYCADFLRICKLCETIVAH